MSDNGPSTRRYCPCGYSHDPTLGETKEHAHLDQMRAFMQMVDNAVYTDCETRRGTDD